MKPSPRQPRTRSKLSDSLRHRLNMYALAASAAGVAALALAQPAEGKVIYTKAHKHIGPNTTFHLDLNHDGTADFGLYNYYSSSPGGPWVWLSARPDQSRNALRGHMASGVNPSASALSAGVRVGPTGPFLPGWGLMAAVHENHPGSWYNVIRRYLGLKFVIRGKVHFGWARLNVSCSNIIEATLTGYAYETIPNKPIVTGKTKGPDVITLQPNTPRDSLGKLALGRR